MLLNHTTQLWRTTSCVTDLSSPTLKAKPSEPSRDTLPLTLILPCSKGLIYSSNPYFWGLNYNFKDNKLSGLTHCQETSAPSKVAFASGLSSHGPQSNGSPVEHGTRLKPVCCSSCYRKRQASVPNFSLIPPFKKKKNFLNCINYI